MIDNMTVLKLTINTPPNKAVECINTNKKVFLGKLKTYVVEEKILSHNQYYWKIVLIDQKDVMLMYKKCASGEIMIKTFFRELIKNIRRTNKVRNKLGKGAAWVRKQLTVRLLKKLGIDRKQDIDEYLDGMKDHELIHIEDEEEMQVFLNNPIIVIEEVKI